MESKQHIYRNGEHPREKANIFSILTFSWTIPTFIKGWKESITPETLHAPLKSHRSDQLGEKLNKAWNEEVTKKNPSLLKAFCKCFGRELFVYGIFIGIAEIIFRISQPLILGELIDHITSDVEDTYTTSAIASGLIFSCFASILITHMYFICVGQLGMKLRISTCSLIYRKVLQLKNMNNLTTGQIVNLMSNDASRFDYAATFMHDLWIGPVQTCIITYFLYGITGVAAFVGLIAIFIFTPFQVSLGKLTSKLRMKTALRSDYRIGLMDELVKGIQVVKMHAWEKPVSKLVSDARKKEINIIKLMSNIKGLLVTFSMFHSRAASSLTIITFVLLGGKLTSKNIFTITSFFNVLNTTACLSFPMGISYISEFLTSVRRVQNFLLLENSHYETENNNMMSENIKQPVVEMNNVSAMWKTTSSEDTITNISFNATNKYLTVLLGPVGAGKSSTLHALLGELYLTNGALTLNGKTSLSTQEPWIFTETIRQNILFGETYNEARYKEVIRVCALNDDLEKLEDGDLTQVGERGMMLSGGQKARINLARAVYKDADIYLIDNPLSAVDTIVANHLYYECIKGMNINLYKTNNFLGFLKGKIVILVTHQVKFLSDDDQIVYLENGSMKFIGKLKDLIESDLFTADMLYNNDEPGEKPTIEEPKISSPVVENKQITEKKASTWSSYYNYIKAIGIGSSLIIFLLFLCSQICASLSDYWLSYWVYLEEEIYPYNKTTYIMPDRDDCIYIFAGIISGTVIFSLVRSFVYFFFCLQASKRLHQSMFLAITRAKMSFFNNNSSGNILSRFSKDMGVLDEHLPLVTMDFLQIGLMAIGIIVLVPTTNPWLIIPTFIALFIFIIMRILYVSTSKNMRKLETVTSTPVYTHLSNSLQGLSIIRACKKENLILKEFDAHQDYHSSSWFMYIATARAFALWLDLVSLLYSGAIILSFVLMKQDGGSVGLAITQSFGLFSILQWGVRQSAEMDNHMISVDRIVEFTKVEQEPPLESPKGISMIKGWPKRGDVDFVNVMLKYNPESPWILKNLTFEIAAGDKVGIVGRTGSGKSSIINALFRMAEIEGVIKIDGVDLSSIGLHEFRPKITVIPQEPFLFSGTLRKNLDPFDAHKDPELWDCLEDVDLKQFVQNNHGLNMHISEGGQNLSVGQKQLIFLARAILSRNKIIVMDEATSNIDLNTEILIQRTIRQKFQFATVITIAHRLSTIIESDMIIVVDSGNIVELGHPYVLLHNERGIFYNLIAENGGLTDETYESIKERYTNGLHINEKCI